jgi:hypothetical protein
MRHWLWLLLPLGTPCATGATAPPLHARPAGIQAATRLGVNIPVVGRLTGGGNVVYKTAIDVSNNTLAASAIDFYLDGTDLASQTPIAVNGSISPSGAIVAQGSGGQVRARSNLHFDDFVDSLVMAGLLPPSIEADGFIGSVLFTFNGFTQRGQGCAGARFYSAYNGGTVGVSASGHTVTTNEPKKLVGTFRNTVGRPGPQLYANLFINNIGVTPSGSDSATAVSVFVAAYANSTGHPVGTPVTIAGINPGATAIFDQVLQRLSVPAGEDTVLVYVTVLSGSGAIEALAVEVDDTTKDGSALELVRADF